jgi:hypothetical protein
VVGNAAAGKHRKHKKKATLCLNGQTIQASSKKKQKLLRRGATAGACCTPTCNGTSCGGSDGCGGTCGCSGSTVCHEGTCRACTVTCTGSDISCGLRLGQALEVGGDVFVCPGRYAGNFVVTKTGTTLVGAGPGEDPRTNTILDGRGGGTVVACNGQLTAFIGGVRITGGKPNAAADQDIAFGAGVVSFGADLQINNFSIVDNHAQDGAGITATHRLRMTHGTIERNIATEAGGGIFLVSPESSSIDDVYIARHHDLR